MAMDVSWRRAGQVAGLACLAFFGLVDFARGGRFAIPSPFGLAVGVGHFALVVAAAGVWLAARRLGPSGLVAAAAVVVMWSLLVTALYVVSGGTRPYWGLAESAALLGVTYALARWARPILALGSVPAAGFAAAVVPIRAGLTSGHVIIGMGWALLAAVAAAAGMYMRLAVAARERQLATVRAEQRAEFARDLHDFVAHHVTGIVVQAQGARYIAGTDPQRAAEALEQIERSGAEAMAAMRRMVGVLRGDVDAPTAPLATLADVEQLVADFVAAGPVKAYLHVDGRLDDLPVEVSSSAYRVVMEALTNVRQHAPTAQRADVWITRTPDWLLVRVSNDGPVRRDGHGQARPRFGLAGLAERVGALGGRLRAEPDASGGWIVDAAIPLNGRGRR